ncbi:hypothetical protein B0H17DRAFT_959255, partial [Mycena rosella]
VLYRLHASVLSSRSAFFQFMFSLPRVPAASSQVLSEGAVDENPIELPPGITQFDFDNLLTYLYQGQSDHPKRNEFLVSVLTLSTFYGIKDGQKHAIAQFTQLGNTFHPALQLQLARNHRVNIWIEPAFRKLVEMLIESLTMEHIEQIGLAGFFQLIQTKEKLLNVQRKIAFHIPPIINDGNCDTPGFCSHAWGREWRESMPRIIHHPDTPAGCVELLNALRSVNVQDLCKACQKLSVTWLWGKGWVQREEKAVEEGIAALMICQTGSPTLADRSQADSDYSD